MAILIPTRLWLSVHQRQMLARHRGVELQISAAPSIDGLPERTVEIDYFSRRGELRVSSGPRRELTKEEADAIFDLLERMALAARAVFHLGD